MARHVSLRDDVAVPVLAEWDADGTVGEGVGLKVTVAGNEAGLQVHDRVAVRVYVGVLRVGVLLLDPGLWEGGRVQVADSVAVCRRDLVSVQVELAVTDEPDRLLEGPLPVGSGDGDAAEGVGVKEVRVRLALPGLSDGYRECVRDPERLPVIVQEELDEREAVGEGE